MVSEEDAMNWFPQYALKLRPFYETFPVKAETTQTIVDSIRHHPDWSSAHIAVETGLRECLKHNYVQRWENNYVLFCFYDLKVNKEPNKFQEKVPPILSVNVVKMMSIIRLLSIILTWFWIPFNKNYSSAPLHVHPS